MNLADVKRDFEMSKMLGVGMEYVDELVAYCHTRPKGNKVSIQEIEKYIEDEDFLVINVGLNHTAEETDLPQPALDDIGTVYEARNINLWTIYVVGKQHILCEYYVQYLGNYGLPRGAVGCFLNGEWLERENIDEKRTYHSALDTMTTVSHEQRLTLL